MKPHFELPVRMDGDFLVAADCELISRMPDATPAERAYILRAINCHEALMALLDCAELSQDSLEPKTRDALECVQQALRGE